jgi:hypothetical protein
MLQSVRKLFANRINAICIATGIVISALFFAVAPFQVGSVGVTAVLKNFYAFLAGSDYRPELLFLLLLPVPGIWIFLVFGWPRLRKLFSGTEKIRDTTPLYFSDGARIREENLQRIAQAEALLKSRAAPPKATRPAPARGAERSFPGLDTPSLS